MKGRRAFVAGAVALVLLAALTALRGGGAVDINQKSNGKSVHMTRGQFLEISLPSNPSTGYGWQYADKPDSTVLMSGEREFRPDSSGLIGAGGTEYLRFQAVGAGSTAIRLAYERPWEKNVPPAKTFSVRVVVTDRHGIGGW